MLISDVSRYSVILTRIYLACQLKDSLKFTFLGLLHFHKILKKRNLSEICKKMGYGPFKIKLDKKIITVVGHEDDLNGAFSGLIEIFINKVYDSKYLDISKYNTVLDFGAGSGNFTNFVLSKNPNLKIILIEPRRIVHKVIEEMVIKNNYKKENIKIFDFFLGSIESVEKNFQKNFRNKIITNSEAFLKKFNLKKIDLIKCDIEGSEYSFFQDGSLLKMTDNITLEIHGLDNVESFIKLLKKFGFQIKKIMVGKKDAIVIATKN